ncbi:MAG TPA: hypothetical protein VL380_02010, partial [Nitrosospira sp.]|nr:hypothetical protein [Nitrosospira sp.]
ERGKVILAEFGFGGKLLLTFKLDPTVPRFLAWLLKARFLPWFYWHGFLKGREWFAVPPWRIDAMEELYLVSLTL